MTTIKEQTVLITGSTDGVGKLLARKFADEGTRVLIHGRNEQKVSRTVQEISTETGNKKIEGYIADFSTLKAVRKLADEVQAKNNRLDILINNAGIGFGRQRELSKDGYELRFAVNYLAPFLLTHLLLPSLQQAAPSRIVNVSSLGQARIDFSDVMLEKEFNPRRAYRQSKLALIMFTIDLSEALKPGNITANCLHPGTYLRTKMVTEAGIPPLGEAEEGADAVFYLATSPELEGITGKYFNQKTAGRAHDQAYDIEARNTLHKLSEEYTGFIS